ncbi:hypothetical protein BGZ54_007893 [Gamsiella multidivaricata]|nr:hypothetical protein BGZ54_007893 [Gamsiella multidivaricata]
MSDNEHKKRSLDDLEGPDSDSDERRHKRVAVPDLDSDNPEKPLHRRRDDEDVKMSTIDDAETDLMNTDIALRALVTTKEAGVIIGKSGKNVNEIREQSGAKLSISEIIPGASERILTVKGRLDTVAKAYALVGHKMVAEQGGTDVAPETESASISMLVPHHLMGFVIGKGGAKIKEIQEASGARAKASEEMLPGSTERTLLITGVPDAIHIAVYHVGQILQEKGNETESRGRSVQTVLYRPMRRNDYGGYPPAIGFSPQPHSSSRHSQPHYSDYGPSSYSGGGGSGSSSSSGSMHGLYGLDYAPTSAGGGGAVTQAQQIFIPNDMVGTVIGKNGSKIQEIRQISGSHIKIADSHQGSGNERLVTITGTPESNQMAVYLLYSRLESEKTRLQ